MSGSADLTELRRVRRRATLVRWAVVAGSVCVVAALGAIAWFSPLLAVTTVTAEGGGIVDTGSVRADVEARTVGVPLLQVRTQTLAEQLETDHTAAETIDVSYSGLRSLHITVIDRQPVIAVVDGSEATRYDADGISIDTVAADGLVVPVLSVEAGADPATAAREGAALLTQIDGILSTEIDGLTAAAGGSFSLRVLTEEGSAVIHFGTAEDAERKAQVAAVLLGEGHERIDVSVPDVATAG